ncbi:hypothetical protein [Parasphingorhabdus sp.]|uniref:hypothetical protein n=1 Tax=Parasphingorhabdus sp. TaxID=2709688 RepID=UPI00326356EF
MKLNYMDCWNGAIAILSEHKEAILAIAGVFLFLPSVLLTQFVGQPDVEGLTDSAAIQAANVAFFSENWFSYVLMLVVTAIGSLSIYTLFSPSFKGTVSDALVRSLGLLFFFIVTNLVVAILMAVGFFLFIIPGLYLIGRLAVVPMIVADQQQRNPVNAIKESWKNTKNNGWAIFLFLLIILLVGMITLIVFSLVAGLIITLVSGGEGLPLLENIVTNLIGTGFQILILAVVASLYRQLTRKDVNVSEVFS